MEDIKKKVHPAAYKLLVASGAKVFTAGSFCAAYLEEYINSLHLLDSWCGWYQPQKDYIVLCPENLSVNPGEEFSAYNALVLHELSHWAGGALRLGRPRMVRAYNLKVGEPFNNVPFEDHNEEVIADMSMYKIAYSLGFACKKLKTRHKEYVDRFYLADKNLCEVESDRAATYLLAMVGKKLRKKEKRLFLSSAVDKFCKDLASGMRPAVELLRRAWKVSGVDVLNKVRTSESINTNVEGQTDQSRKLVG